MSPNISTRRIGILHLNFKKLVKKIMLQNLQWTKYAAMEYVKVPAIETNSSMIWFSFGY